MELEARRKFCLIVNGLSVLFGRHDRCNVAGLKLEFKGGFDSVAELRSITERFPAVHATFTTSDGQTCSFEPVRIGRPVWLWRCI
jgi:hypothetical protein